MFFTGSLVTHVVPLGFMLMWGIYLFVCLILVLTAHQDTLRLLPAPAADWFSGIIGALASGDVAGPA